MTTMLTATDLNQDNGWYPDFGATNHLTNNFNNLAVGTEYLGGNQMQVGNGTGLLISHCGYTSFSSTNHVFHLKNLLHVPQITKNLKG